MEETLLEEPEEATITEPPEECFELMGIEELTNLRKEMSRSAMAEKIVLSVGRDLHTTEGASLIVKDTALSESILKRIASRMADGIVKELPIKRDTAFTKLANEMLRFQVSLFFDQKTEEKDIFSHLCQKSDSLFNKVLNSLSLGPDLSERIINIILKRQGEFLSHMISTAVFCLGVASEHPAFTNMPAEMKLKHLGNLLISALFSDISLVNEENPLAKDRGSFHAATSAELVGSAGFDFEVCEPIRISHSFENKEAIPYDMTSAQVLALSEYFHAFIFEQTKGKTSNLEPKQLEQFFFDQGYIENLNLFDQISVDIIARIFDSYKSAQFEGRQISAIVEQCVYPDNKGPSAVPYPLSRSATQVLCRGHHGTCPHYDEKSGTIFFSRDTIQGNMLTMIAISAGTYGKCKMEKLLPANRKSI